MDYDALEKHKDKIKDYDKLTRHLKRKVKVEIVNDEGQKDEFEFYPASFEVYGRFMTLAPELEKEELSFETGKGLMDIMVLVVQESYGWPEEVCRQFVATNFETMGKVLEKIMPQTPNDVEKIKKIQKKYLQSMMNNEQPGTAEVKDPQ